MKFKVVINVDYGGFDLSNEALRMLAERRGLSIFETKDQYLYGGTRIEGARSCPHLIAVVEKLGVEAAAGKYSVLEVVELEDPSGRYAVDEYDGWEGVFTPTTMEKRWSVALNSCNEGD